MTRFDRISALVILAFGLLACLECIRMGLWNGDVPGSGFFPLVAAGGMTLLAVMLLVTGRNAASEGKKPFRLAKDELKQLGAFVPGLLLYPVLVYFLGFALASVLFLAVLFRHPGRYGWMTSVVVSLMVVGALYAGLVLLLKAELPTGPLGI